MKYLTTTAELISQFIREGINMELIYYLLFATLCVLTTSLFFMAYISNLKAKHEIDRNRVKGIEDAFHNYEKRINDKDILIRALEGGIEELNIEVENKTRAIGNQQNKLAAKDKLIAQLENEAQNLNCEINKIAGAV